MYTHHQMTWITALTAGLPGPFSTSTNENALSAVHRTIAAIIAQR